MNDTERIDRLEKLVERLLKEYELLSIYVPKLTGILNRYWDKQKDYRSEIIDHIKLLETIVNTDKKRKHYKEYK